MPEEGKGHLPSTRTAQRTSELKIIQKLDRTDALIEMHVASVPSLSRVSLTAILSAEMQSDQPRKKPTAGFSDMIWNHSIEGKPIAKLRRPACIPTYQAGKN